jgi:hypothetical protein
VALDVAGTWTVTALAGVAMNITMATTAPKQAVKRVLVIDAFLAKELLP